MELIFLRSRPSAERIPCVRRYGENTLKYFFAIAKYPVFIPACYISPQKTSMQSHNPVPGRSGQRGQHTR